MKITQKVTALLLAAIMCASLLSVQSFAQTDARLNAAVEKAVAIANDQSHGYSMARRDGNPDYDCSSFVCRVFYDAGFKVKLGGNTTTMYTDFQDAGFEFISDIDLSTPDDLEYGDIMWVSGHTEIYIGGGRLVGAHSDQPSAAHPNRSPEPGDQGDEISVCDYYNAPWTGVLRFSPEKEAQTNAGEPEITPHQASIFIRLFRTIIAFFKNLLSKIIPG